MGVAEQATLAPSAGHTETCGSRHTINGLTEILDGISKIAASADASNRSPIAEFDQLRVCGFGSARLPVEYGGAGMELEEFISVLIAVAKADPSLAHAWIAHFTFTEDLRRSSRLLDTWAHDIVTDKLLFANAAVPTARTPMTLRPADSNPGTYVLDGAKHYCTGSVYCTHLQVFAELAGERVNVIVSSDAPGVVVEDNWNGFGQRQSASGDVSFTAVQVHDEQILRLATSPSPTGYLLAFSQLFLLAILAGIAESAAEDLVAWLGNKRSHFSHGAATDPRDDPLMQAVVGAVISKADSAAALVLHAARRLDRDAHSGVEDVSPAFMAICACQAVVVDLVNDATSQIFDAGGGSMTSNELGLDRHWRNARTVACHNPVNLRLKDIGARFLQSDASLPI
jgi:alkylation response protein AidB-like acyl-CoA dehydrogenase